MAVRLMTGRFSAGRVLQSAVRILRANRLCSIATVTARNRAHINTAYFCYSGDLEVFFLSDPHSRHSRNLASNPSAAMAIFSSAQKWGGPDRGMQLFGTCREAKGRQATKAARLYGKRFPAYPIAISDRKRGDGRLPGLRTYRFYEFRPTALTILDESDFGDAVFVVAVVRRAA
jgi:uncharacterized protein YhbP (UPF0306 family)